MKRGETTYITESAFRHPVLDTLNKMSQEMLGIGLFVVFPQTDGWGQVSPGGDEDMTEFCRLVQSSEGGNKHCRMCHVLMSVATCSEQAPLQQTCHSGLSVLMAPATVKHDECFAVLSTCTFVQGTEIQTWQDMKQRARKLGVDMRALKKAYEDLPRLDEAQVRHAHRILEAAAQAVRLIRDRVEADAECGRLRRFRPSRDGVRTLVEQHLQQSTLVGPGADDPSRPGDNGSMPVLLQVMGDLLTRRPDVPYSVAEVAAAARLSPNHFSALFHKHMKTSFSEFLLEKRIELAKEVLRDLTLNITEVARKVGYDDPGYFARRFRLKTGLSPRQWREQLIPL